jgi:methanogenic corrinoid protein MtbC1
MRSTPPVPNGKRALQACAEGNLHTVGLRMVSHALVLAGWEIQFLGSNVPNNALIKQVEIWRPDH